MPVIESTMDFEFIGNELRLKFPTSTLEVYSWEPAPDALTGEKHVYVFLFYGDKIRLLQLTKDEAKFRIVKSETHSARVQYLTDSDIEMFREDAAMFLRS